MTDAFTFNHNNGMANLTFSIYKVLLFTSLFLKVSHSQLFDAYHYSVQILRSPILSIRGFYQTSFMQHIQYSVFFGGTSEI